MTNSTTPTTTTTTTKKKKKKKNNDNKISDNDNVGIDIVPSATNGMHLNVQTFFDLWHYTRLAQAMPISFFLWIVPEKNYNDFNDFSVNKATDNINNDDLSLQLLDPMGNLRPIIWILILISSC